MELVRPCPEVRDSYLRGLLDDQREGRRLSLDATVLAEDFVGYLQGLVRKSDPAAPRPEGRVPETVLWYVAGTTYLGELRIRHDLTPALRDKGGHIGYQVVPTERRRGHATRMLAAALPVAAELGIDQALVTCDPDNIASRKVIEANGGVLFEQTPECLRFYIPTRQGR